MNNARLIFAAMAFAAMAAGPVLAADAKGGNARIDAADCAGFTVQDAAPFLGVPAAQVVRTAAKISNSLVACSFAAGKTAPGVAFSIEIEKSAKKAAEQMEGYRDSLSIAGDSAPWKGKLPKGAYSDIMGDGMGDEAVWTDINGALTVRKSNVTVQITMPKAKLEQIKVAKAVVAKF